jgi:hypothetical protein
MRAAASEKNVTLCDVDWRALKVGDKKPLAIQIVSLNPRWKRIEEDAQRLAKPYLDGKALEQACGKKINRADVVAAIANAGSGVSSAAEQPPIEVLD